MKKSLRNGPIMMTWSEKHDVRVPNHYVIDGTITYFFHGLHPTCFPFEIKIENNETGSWLDFFEIIKIGRAARLFWSNSLIENHIDMVNPFTGGQHWLFPVSWDAIPVAELNSDNVVSGDIWRNSRIWRKLDFSGLLSNIMAGGMVEAEVTILARVW